MAVQKISADNPIFSSDSFLRDKVSFSAMLVLTEQPGSEIYSDEANFIIVVSPEKDEVWIWTINDIKKERSDEMWRFVEYIGMDIPNKFHIFIKSVLTNNPAVNLKIIRVRFAYQCTKLNDVIESHGYIHKVTEADEEKVASLIKECNELEEDEATNRAEVLMKKSIPYLWMDSGEQAVAMSVLKPSAAGFTRIGALHIRPDCRSMGYERSLIHQMSQEIIADGKIPMLYVTDSPKNNASTRYTDMGFIRCGRIAEVEIA